VDDHPVVLKGIAACLSSRPGIQVVGEAFNGSDALRKARELSPDVALVDLDMPQMSGLALSDQLRMHVPKARVILLTMHRRSEYIVRAIQSGARGYVLKNRPAEEFATAVERVHSGGTYFCEDVARAAINQFVRAQAPELETHLTTREKEVLVQIAEGLSNKEIACLLNLGVRTVETHRERIMRKLDIHSIAGLTRYAISEGYVALQTAVA
jgi:DNA-binding NarL/FixJ family response regulator